MNKTKYDHKNRSFHNRIRIENYDFSSFLVLVLFSPYSIYNKENKDFLDP